MSLNWKLDGEVAVVVGGGGGGIGTAMCQRLAEAGSDVIAITNLAEHAADTASVVATSGRRVATAVADVTDAEALRSAIASGVDELGTATMLVNVVGGVTMPHWHRLLDYDLDSFDHLISMNLRYVLVAAQTVANGLVDAGLPGSIVNISSIASKGQPLLAGYSAAKAGLDALTRTMAAEWGRYDIRVNGVAPGTINTPRSGRPVTAARDPEDPAAGTLPLGRRGIPDDIASAALFFLSSGASYITGQTIAVDGGGSTRSGDLDDSDLPTFVSNPAIRERFAPIAAKRV